MPSAIVTSRGRITVPKPVREALGLHPGDTVDFHVRDDGTIVLAGRTVDLRALRGVFKPRVRRVSVGKMKGAIRRAGSRR